MVNTDRDYWCVSLKGSSEDLDLLASIEDVDWYVEKDDETYYLVAPEFQSCSEASEVWSIAENLIPSVRLAAFIVFPHFKDVDREKVFEILKNGERHGAVLISARGGIVIGSRVELSDGRTPYKEVYEAISTDPVLMEAARYFAARDRGWTFFLWKTYELIRADITNELHLSLKDALASTGVGWITNDDFERFRTAVNSHRASGDDARHSSATSQSSKPDHTNHMSRSEAESFIRGLLLKWVQHKHKNRSGAI